MARFKLKDGREAPAVTAMECSLDEVLELETLLGVGMDEWSPAAEMKAFLWHSFRLAYGADAPTWEEIGALRPADVERVADEDDDPPGGGGGRSPEQPDDARGVPG